MLYLGVSDTHEAQLNILKALTRKFRLDPDLDLKDIAEQCPFNYTGADFYALCSDAMLKSMSRKAQEIDKRLGIQILVSRYCNCFLCLLTLRSLYRGAQCVTASVQTSTSFNTPILLGGDGDSRGDRRPGFTN